MAKVSGNAAGAPEPDGPAQGAAGPVPEGPVADGATKAEGAAAPRVFAHAEAITQTQALVSVFGGFKGGDVTAEIHRPRMMMESVEHGRGRGFVRGFVVRRFAEEPHPVLLVTAPRGLSGGSFEPADRMLRPGEQFQVSFTMLAPGADRPVLFAGRGVFLRKSFFVAENPERPDRPWVGSREDAEKLPKHLQVAGEDIIEVRIDAVTAFPRGPGSVRRDVLARYASAARLYVVPNGAVWNHKSAQGNFFASIRDPLDRYLTREGVKVITPVVLDDFGNLGDVTVLIETNLLEGIEHDSITAGVIRNPNEHVRAVNNSLGFLLFFKVTDEIKESIVRSFPAKAGKEEDVYLPLLLHRAVELRGRWRCQFRLFPRDLVEERQRRTADRGLHFNPPFALHPGAENHVTYSKLLVALNQRFHEDTKPEDEKLKDERLLASVQQRVSEQRHKFVDEKVKAAFRDRVAAAKRREEGS